MRTKISILAICLIAMIACEQDEKGPMVKQGGMPSVLSNISVENLNGGANITYTLPDDPTLLYVMATYSLSSGVERTVKSSVFKNSLLLEGFSTTEEREITLYTVDRSENKSAPMKVKVNPLVSPLEFTFTTLDVRGDFGGVTLSVFNETETDFVFYTMRKTETGDWIILDQYYSSAREINHSIRGLQAESQEFAFVIQDKWQNQSDTLFRTLTPLYEEELAKSLWRHYRLDNDIPIMPASPVSNLWSGTSSNYSVRVVDAPGLVLPNWITIDLGQTAVLGRMKMQAITSTTSNYQWLYSTGSPRLFEIWGSNDPTPDGNWDSWTRLGEFESIKPSGLPIGYKTAEDIAQGLAGEDYKFENYDTAYRYIRFVLVQTWGGIPTLMMQELTFWGEPVN